MAELSPDPQFVSFSTDAHRREGYMARPAGNGPFPGIIVIHEILGMTEHIKQVAQRFADAGYVALAVDLFAGRNRAVCMFRFMSQQFLHPQTLDNGSIQDLRAALTYLAEQPDVDGERVGAIGFCLGGGFAIAWACTDNRLKAIAPFYATNPRPLEAVARLCPIVGSYPDKDFTTAHGQKLDVLLDQYNIPHDIKIYPGTRHSFFKRAYAAAASEDAWQRTIAFFREHGLVGSTPIARDK